MQRKNMILLNIIFALVLILGFSLFAINKCIGPNKYDTNINLAMKYIYNHTEASGRFIYKTNINDYSTPKNSGYSILRHAGTLYSMYLCEKYFNSDMLREKRLQASKYFIENYLVKVEPDMYAVADLSLEPSKSDYLAKVGGAGLALAGLSNLYKENKVDLNILRGLGNFVLFMQNPDGSFYSTYDVKTKQKNGKDHKYYPGEAAYGLLFLNEADPSEKWVKASKEAIIYLAKSRANYGDNVPFDHWAVLATKKLFELPQNTLTQEEKALLIKHATQIAQAGLKIRYNEDKGLCSAATNMEGMSAIYHIIEDKVLKSKVKQSIEIGNRFLANNQIKSGILEGGIPRTPKWQDTSAPRKNGAVRIDNVQHTLSAWIMYRDLGKK